MRSAISAAGSAAGPSASRLSAAMWRGRKMRKIVPLPTSLSKKMCAAGLLDDAVDGRKAEPGALADLLGREERLEDLGLDLRRNAGAGVLDLDQHIVGRRQRLVAEGRDLRRLDVARADRQRAAVRHRVAGIDGEVDDHLLELVEVGLDRPEVAAVHELQLDLLAEQPLQQDREVRQHVAERQHLRPQRLPAREGEQLPHQAGGAVGVLLDVHDVLEGRVARPVVGEQEVGEADDRRQHIVEVVRDAAGELADRLHLLALARTASPAPAARSCRAHRR